MAAATRRRERLGSLNPSKNAEPWQYQSHRTKQRAMPPPPPKKVERRKCCERPIVSEDPDGQTVCYSCGHIFNDSAIVSEVTFGETAGGAAIVEGGFIGDHQRHANSMGGTMRGLGGLASREQAQLRGKDEIQKLCYALGIRQSIQDQAVGWYTLAMNYNFIQGRRIRNVAAVAIYTAARRQPQNTLMLMDLAEKVQVNVWALGDTYKAFIKLHNENDPAHDTASGAVLEIEPLMLKFCRKLEFEDDSFKVASDACKLLKRMSRDWMVQGRQPAGLCGACIILAARMNNFRRTVREVVYVVKVADATINSRLYEYRKTPSSALTVQQFLEFGERLPVTTLPPAIWRREEKEERVEKRKAAAENAESAEVLEGDGSGSDAAEPPAPARTSKRHKTNAGKAQPAPQQLETPQATQLTDTQDSSLDALADAIENGSASDINDEDFTLPKKVKKRPGRKPKKPTPIPISPEDLQLEDDIEQDVNQALTDWQRIFTDIAADDTHPLYKHTGFTAQKLAQAATGNRLVDLSADIADDEFDDDPDVATCLLSPAEVELKERIWLTQNADWLREQQQKMLAAELEAAQDKPKKPKQTRRHQQMGDGSLLEGKTVSGAAEAAGLMLKRRGAKQWSNYINYDRLKSIFPDSGGAGAGTPGRSVSASASADASPAAAGGLSAAVTPAAVTPGVRSPPTVQVTDADAEVTAEADAEEEQEQEEEEEDVYGEEDEEDLEHAYMQDDDEGFGNAEYDDDY